VATRLAYEHLGLKYRNKQSPQGQLL
jgi:hypothetical protein